MSSIVEDSERTKDLEKQVQRAKTKRRNSKSRLKNKKSLPKSRARETSQTMLSNLKKLRRI